MLLITLTQPSCWTQGSKLSPGYNLPFNSLFLCKSTGQECPVTFWPSGAPSLQRILKSKPLFFLEASSGKWFPMPSLFLLSGMLSSCLLPHRLLFLLFCLSFSAISSKSFPGPPEALEHLWNAWNALSTWVVGGPLGGPDLPSWVPLSALHLKRHLSLYSQVMWSTLLQAMAQWSKSLHYCGLTIFTCGYQSFYACLYPPGRKGEHENHMGRLFRE